MSGIVQGVLEQEFRDPRLPALYALWSARRAGSGLPLAEGFDPEALPRLKPILNLMEVRHDPQRFRHRFVGSEIRRATGQDFTGQAFPSADSGETAGQILDSLVRLVREARPYRRFARQDWQRGRLTAETIELPLADADQRVVAVVRGVTYGLVAPPLPERMVFEPLALLEGAAETGGLTGRGDGSGVTA